MSDSISINECALFRCRSKKRLSSLLYISLQDIKRLSTGNAYKLLQEERNGKTREIYCPNEELKTVQKRIKRLLEKVTRPDWVFSGAKCVCHVDNGKWHSGNRYFILSDLNSFYDKCSRGYVYIFFRQDLECDPDIADILTGLCLVSLKDGRSFIPMGSPCSQLVAFFSYRKMFEEINEAAQQNGYRFSLYVDDLTFSSHIPMVDPKRFIHNIDRIVCSYGHKLNKRKSRYCGPNAYKVVTGVALDGQGEVHIPNRLGQRIVTGVKLVADGDDTKRESTLGRINAANQIVLSAFPEARRIVEKSGV